MRNEFLFLAKAILNEFKNLFSDGELNDDYVYQNIPRLINEVETWTFSNSDTDIGIAAIKLADMGVYKHKKMVDDIVHLGSLYRLMQKPADRK